MMTKVKQAKKVAAVSLFLSRESSVKPKFDSAILSRSGLRIASRGSGSVSEITISRITFTKEPIRKGPTLRALSVFSCLASDHQVSQDEGQKAIITIVYLHNLGSLGPLRSS